MSPSEAIEVLRHSLSMSLSPNERAKALEALRVVEELEEELSLVRRKAVGAILKWAERAERAEAKLEEVS
jgi:hypothetical protein